MSRRGRWQREKKEKGGKKGSERCKEDEKVAHQFTGMLEPAPSSWAGSRFRSRRVKSCRIGGFGTTGVDVHAGFKRGAESIFSRESSSYHRAFVLKSSGVEGDVSDLSGDVVWQGVCRAFFTASHPADSQQRLEKLLEKPVGPGEADLPEPLSEERIGHPSRERQVV